MIIFLLVMIFLAILWPGMIRFALGMLLVIGLFSIHANAAPVHGTCSGRLIISQGEYMLGENDSESVCTFDKLGGIAVTAICSVGHYCKVIGMVDVCKDSGECSEFSHITSIQSDGRGKPARLTDPGLD